VAVSYQYSDEPSGLGATEIVTWFDSYRISLSNDIFSEIIFLRVWNPYCNLNSF
jgi:hypothetical protein